MIPSPPRVRRLRGILVALAVSALLTVLVPPAAGEPVAGSAGIDTSLPATDSQVTVSGRGPFADLKVTVNQTKNLSNRAISVTWTGGTVTSGGSFSAHYLQLMQCWGDDDGTVPGNPGPLAEQCVQGAVGGLPGGVPSLPFPSGSASASRLVSRRAWANFDSTPGHLDEQTGNVWKPFRAVDGKVVTVPQQPGFNPELGGDFWLNPFFNVFTTNEIAGGRTGPNGTGAELFEVNTGLESSGLGCGQRVEPVPGGDPKIPRCWLVVVPRGSPAYENVGTPGELMAEQQGVLTSPLAPQSWQNRIAVPLEFNPVDTPCTLADEQRRIVGSELAVPAVSSWQPQLCATPGLSPYAYSAVSDASARRQLTSTVPGSPGMVVVSRPLDASATTASNPVIYAPLSLSATVIGFNVERVPKDTAGPAAAALAGVRVAEINLTPRLVAKLLTQSYRQQTKVRDSTPPYDWVRDNPMHAIVDPDFLQFNPEFDLLGARNIKNAGGLLLPARNSDAARQVWEYVLADPEARAWLDGTPDPWGMKVNPIYATTTGANSSGAAFADPVPDTFPKSDPYCYQAPPQGVNGAIVPPPLCGPDWLPYTQSMRDAARLTRAADDGARINLDVNALTAGTAYKRDAPQTLGSRTMLSLTDSASAAQYGIQAARLSRAGDNSADRTFIAPNEAGMTAGAESMTAKAVPAVLEPDPAAAAPSAYPLTALTYAAVAPLALDAQARAEYSAFVDYAAGAGQEPGLEIGQLPRGYAPLPAALRMQATEAAKTIRELAPAAAPTTPPRSGSPPTSAAAPRSTPAGSSSSSGLTSTGPPASAAAPASPLAVLDTDTGTVPTTTPRATALTPVLALARSRFVLPGLMAIALLSALGALEIAKRPRLALGGRAGRAVRAPGDHGVGVRPREGVMNRWSVTRLAAPVGRRVGGWRSWRARQ